MARQRAPAAQRCSAELGATSAKREGGGGAGTASECGDGRAGPEQGRCDRGGAPRPPGLRRRHARRALGSRISDAVTLSRWARLWAGMGWWWLIKASLFSLLVGVRSSKRTGGARRRTFMRGLRSQGDVLAQDMTDNGRYCRAFFTKNGCRSESRRVSARTWSCLGCPTSRRPCAPFWHTPAFFNHPAT